MPAATVGPAALGDLNAEKAVAEPCARLRREGIIWVGAAASCSWRALHLKVLRD